MKYVVFVVCALLFAPALAQLLIFALPTILLVLCIAVVLFALGGTSMFFRDKQ